MANGVPRHLIDELTGILVAADLPHRMLEAGLAGKIEPIRLVMVNHDTNEQFELPVRSIAAKEAVMLVNRFLMEGTMEFGFKEKKTHRMIGTPT